MKTQELRNLIREEVRKVLKEAKEASKQLSWNAIKPGDKITYVVPGSSNKTATGKVVSKDSTRTEDFLIVIDDKTKKKMNIMMSHVGSVNENSVQFKESILKEVQNLKEINVIGPVPVGLPKETDYDTPGDLADEILTRVDLALQAYYGETIIPEMGTDWKKKEAIVHVPNDKDGKKIINDIQKHFSKYKLLKGWKVIGKYIKESILKEADIPQNITDFAKRKGVLPVVKQVASWAKKSGKKIRGGTAIGKDYGTLILDLTYQGGEIRINTNTEEIEVNGELVSDYAEFKEAIA